MSRVAVVVSLIGVAAFWVSAAHAEDRAVSAAETPVRSAPFDVAPEIARLHAGDRVCADDQAQGAWRRVGLSDGRFGFVRDADTQGAPADPTKPCAPSPVIVAAPVQPSPAPIQSQPSSRGADERHLLGVMFELMPVGTIALTPSGGDTRSADSLFAVAVAPFFEGALSPYVALGFSPQVIFRVKSDQITEESAKEIDFRARLTGRLPLSPRVRAFARISPAYSLILVPSLPPGTAGSRSNPAGFLINGAVGLEIAVLPNLFVVSDLGYQAGFQSSTDGETHTSYLHLGAGFAIGL